MLEPLAPWRRPLQPCPSDKLRRRLWWERAAFWLLAAMIVAWLWR